MRQNINWNANAVTVVLKLWCKLALKIFINMIKGTLGQKKPGWYYLKINSINKHQPAPCCSDSEQRLWQYGAEINENINGLGEKEKMAGSTYNSAP